MGGDIEADLLHLVAEMTTISDDARQSFGNLTAQQLNWKPSNDAWSVGQCFDHLISAHKAYIPIIEEVLKGKKQSTLWEKIPLLPNLFGKLLIKYLSPQSTRKLKAPAVFKPSSSSIDEGVIGRFVELQKELTLLMKRSEGLNLSQIKITSPAVRFVSYSLKDGYEIIVVHDKRHVQQAKRVLEAEGFPTT